MSAPSEGIGDRRLHPRVLTTQGEQLWLMMADAEVLDISTRGILLSTARPLQVGHRVRLHIEVGQEPLQMLIEVCRVARSSSVSSTGRWHAAGVIVDVDAPTRQRLQQLLNQSTAPGAEPIG